jgi:hypothetical protein
MQPMAGPSVPRVHHAKFYSDLTEQATVLNVALKRAVPPKG